MPASSSAPRVLVSDALSPAAVKIFQDRGVHVDFRPELGKDKEALAEAIADYDGLAIRSATKVTPKLLERAGRLRVIGRAGIGVDNVDIPAATARGVIGMHYGPASFHLGRMPEADAFVGSTVTAMEARENGGFALMKEAFAEKLGVELLAHIDSGVQFYIYTIAEPTVTAEGDLDLSGLTLRSQPIYNAFFESLGAVPVSVPVPDVYTGLERNTFDGAGWPIIGIQDLSWDRFLKYRVDPGFYNTDLVVVMNPDAWAGLSDEAKEIVQQAAIDYEQISYDAFQAQIAETNTSVQAAGQTVITLEGEAADRYLDAAYDSAWERMRAAGTERYDALREAYYDR